jgi:hypothetical protein
MKYEDDENEINDIFKNMSKNISKKIESSKKEISERMIEKKNFLKKLKDIRGIPNIRIRFNSEINLNYIINPILFCLANLEIFNEFILSEKKQEIFSKFQGQNSLTVLFFHLLEEMRKINVISTNEISIHNFLGDKLENYLTQDPGVIIKSILSLIDEEMKLANINIENRFSNLIPNNFSITMKTIKKCNACLHKEEISKEKKYVIDLFLFHTDFNIVEPLQSVFNNLLSENDELNIDKLCKRCRYETIIIKEIENLNKYLIINLNREKDPNNTMKLIYSETLNLIEEKEDGTNKKYQYKLISVLSDINSNINNLAMAQQLSIIQINKISFKIFFRNFINDKWYKILDNEPPKLFENIEEEINKFMPNILIYKRSL